MTREELMQQLDYIAEEVIKLQNDNERILSIIKNYMVQSGQRLNFALWLGEQELDHKEFIDLTAWVHNDDKLWDDSIKAKHTRAKDNSEVLKRAAEYVAALDEATGTTWTEDTKAIARALAGFYISETSKPL